ncbi:MAG TPA: hypothetical protein VGO25_08080, partial [Rhodanobacteraceae bacterium]|nr:hypothetical protein [Rhodanobacteraceae bacterium]
MKSAFVFGTAFAVMVSFPAFAKETNDPAVNADTKESFTAVSSWVRKEMSAGGRYSYVTDTERSKVDSNLTEMGGLFDKSGSVAQMNDADKTKLFNDQEELNAILSKRDGDRIICKNEIPIGSHIPVKNCRTYSQIEADHHNTRQFMDDRST